VRDDVVRVDDASAAACGGVRASIAIVADPSVRRATLTLAERSLGVASTPDGWHEAGAPCSDAAGCVFPPFGPAARLLQ
jgi:hypothetical protein